MRPTNSGRRSRSFEESAKPLWQTRRTQPEYEEAIGSILEEVDRMSNLVDTLLRLSRGDAGTIRLTHEPTDLGELAREAASSLGILAEERNQTIDVSITDGLVVPVDRLVLREALTNVLDNAIKYSPNKSTVGIRVERVGDRAMVAVTDQGPGVSPEHRELIFDRFFRIDQSRTRNGGGAGLGLAIAKWAVEIHGGQLSVHDGPRGGSEFRIVLSTHQSHQPPTNGHQARYPVEEHHEGIFHHCLCVRRVIDPHQAFSRRTCPPSISRC